MKAQINTNLFPIISVGMYCSNLSPENIFPNSQIDQDREEGHINYDSEYFDDNFQNDLYVKAIQDKADYYLSGTHEIEGIKIDIQTGEIYSPRAYNFSTDQLDLEVTYNKSQVKQYAKNNQEEFGEFLKNNYSSYDGFYSHTANNYEDWKEDFKADNPQSIGAILTYLFLEEMDYFHDGFYDFCNSELFYNEFVDTTPIDEEQQRVENYVKNNYQDFHMEYLDTLELEYLDEETVKNIAQSVIRNIDDHTLELELV